jgi:hypothetical protein
MVEVVEFKHIPQMVSPQAPMFCQTNKTPKIDADPERLSTIVFVLRMGV